MWEQMCTTIVPEWKWKGARRKKAHQIREERKRAQNIKILLPQIESLRNGKNLGNLDFGAKRWFSRDFGEENGGEPIEHIRMQTNDEITEAIVEGFEVLLKRANPHTPSEIIDLEFKDMRHTESYAVLAGADIVFERSQGDFYALPNAN